MASEGHGTDERPDETAAKEEIHLAIEGRKIVRMITPEGIIRMTG